MYLRLVLLTLPVIYNSYNSYNYVHVRDDVNTSNGHVALRKISTKSTENKAFTVYSGCLNYLDVMQCTIP